MSAIHPFPLPRAKQAPPPAQSGLEYRLAIPADARLELARGWLFLGIAALMGSGLFSLLLVLSRTPGLNQWLPVADFFRVALVVHVDLSVLVWFVAFAGLLWSLNGAPRRMRGAGWRWALRGGAAAWRCRRSRSGEPIMANYIPVLDGPLFLAGLVAFGAGVALVVLRAARAPSSASLRRCRRLRFGLNAAVVATAVALLAFAWSSSRCRARWPARPTTRCCSGVAATRCSSPGRC